MRRLIKENARYFKNSIRKRRKTSDKEKTIKLYVAVFKCIIIFGTRFESFKAKPEKEKQHKKIT